MRRLALALVLAVAACSGSDGEPPAPRESDSTDVGLRGESITLDGRRYRCIVFQDGPAGGLWCEYAERVD